VTYHEYRFWSATLGCNACRLSIMDAHGGEHFAIISMDGSGKTNRAARMAALNSIADHIRSGEQPGQVEVTYAES
jgi:Lhr-like helicase